MEKSLESKSEQLAVIQENAEKITITASEGYKQIAEKGTVIIFRQLEGNITVLADWQVKFKPISQILSIITNW
ncbi:MAG: hypothetical protein AB4080_16715 [Trichodesmium sp.]